MPIALGGRDLGHQIGDHVKREPVSARDRARAELEYQPGHAASPGQEQVSDQRYAAITAPNASMLG